MYTHIKTSDELDELIEQLNAKSKLQKEELKLQFDHVLTSMKPANLIKSTFRDVTRTPGFTKSAITSGLALGAGLLSKRFIVRGSRSLFKKVAGMVAEFAVAKTVNKNSDKIQSFGVRMLRKIAQ